MWRSSAAAFRPAHRMNGRMCCGIFPRPLRWFADGGSAGGTGKSSSLGATGCVFAASVYLRSQEHWPGAVGRAFRPPHDWAPNTSASSSTDLPRAHKRGHSSNSQTRIPTFFSPISPPSTPRNRHFRAPPATKHTPTSPSVRAPVTARPLIEACQFPRASSFGLPTAGPRTRAGLPRRFPHDPSSTPKRWLGQQAREDTSAWHRLPSLCA